MPETPSDLGVGPTASLGEGLLDRYDRRSIGVTIEYSPEPASGPDDRKLAKERAYSAQLTHYARAWCEIYSSLW